MANMKRTVDLHKCNRLDEIDRTLKNISRSVFEIANSKTRTKSEMKVKLAKLKREKIEAMALFGKCQAVIASMEVIIAQNELSEELSSLRPKDMKRKCSGSDGNDCSTKKVNTTEGNIDPNTKSSIACAARETKSSKKATRRISKEKVSKAVITKKSEHDVMAAPPPPVTTDKKDITNNNTLVNKQNHLNHQSFPSVGKQIIILSGPPLKNSNQMGYLTNAHQLRHNRIENSIYSLAQNTECFAQKMTLMDSDSFNQKYGNVNHTVNGNYFNNNNSTQLNYNNLLSATHNLNAAQIPKLKEETHKTNNNTKYELNKEYNSSGEMDCPAEDIQTTNEIFKDILSTKGVIRDKIDIKKEHDQYSVDLSEGTLCIDISI